MPRQERPVTPERMKVARVGLALALLFFALGVVMMFREEFWAATGLNLSAIMCAAAAFRVMRRTP